MEKIIFLLVGVYIFLSQNIQKTPSLHSKHQEPPKPSSLHSERPTLPEPSSPRLEPHSYSVTKDLKKEIQKTPVVLEKKEEIEEFIPKIIIDPGHGGNDPGAVRDGVMEKDIVLSIAKLLREAIKKEIPKAEVLLTREEDVFIELEKRSNFANRARGNIFVSLHANTSPNPKTFGAEVYYLSAKASDDEARITAAIENAVLKLESRYEKEVTKFILADMVQHEFIEKSVELAGIVQEELNKALALNEPRNIRGALFYVLKGAMMPAILVEVGYLSNSLERERLKSLSHQELVATSIAKGIKKYIIEHER